MPFLWWLSGSDNKQRATENLHDAVKQALSARKYGLVITHSREQFYHVVCNEVDNHLRVFVRSGQRTVDWSSPDLPSWCRQVRRYIEKEAKQ